MAMTIELARVVHKERMAEAEARRLRKARQVQAVERSASGPGRARRGIGAKVEWPVFSLRIGRFQLVGFRTVRL